MIEEQDDFFLFSSKDILQIQWLYYCVVFLEASTQEALRKRFRTLAFYEYEFTTKNENKIKSYTPPSRLAHLDAVQVHFLVHVTTTRQPNVAFHINLKKHIQRRNGQEVSHRTEVALHNQLRICLCTPRSIVDNIIK